MLPEVDMQDSLNTNKLVPTIAAIRGGPGHPEIARRIAPVAGHEGTLAMLMRTGPFRELDREVIDQYSARHN